MADAPALAARRHGSVPIWLDRPLDLFPEQGLTLDFATFAALVDRAAGMLAGAGLRPGERALVIKSPNFDVVLLAFACARIGAVPVLVHTAVGRESLGVMAQRADAAVVVTDAATEAAGTLDLVATTTPRWYVGERGVSGVSLATVAPGPIPEAGRLRPDDPQLVTHSSGTTGVPKLVLQSLASFAGHARPQILIGRALRVHEPYLLCISPMHARCISGMLAVLALGLPLGFLVDPAPEHAVAMLESVRPGIIETVPNAFIRWERIAQARPDLFAAVRMYVSSFDAAHPRTIRTLLGAARPKARYMQAYGQTESGPVTVKSHRLGRGCQDGRCVGRSLPGQTRIRVVDEYGKKLGRGVAGHILAHSAGVAPQYLGSPDQRVDGWWRMEDYGELSKRGCLHLHDRLIDRGSEVRSLLVAEDELLERLPQLVEAAIIPMPGGGAVPLVVTKDDAPLDLAEWRRVAAGLPQLAEPVQCRWDDIPHTSTWKVKRTEVARLLDAGALPVLPTAATAGEGR